MNSNDSNGNRQEPQQQYDSIDAFDAAIGKLEGTPGVDKTAPRTIVTTTMLVGRASTFIVQTFRQRDVTLEGAGERARDTIFLQHVDTRGSYRVVIPFEVADTIARQREALTGKARTRGARAAAAARKASGVPAGFAAMSPEARRKARKAAKLTRERKAAARAARRAAKGGAK